MLNISPTITPAADYGSPPSHIVFATDFSARCDRAQDRAVQLALEWNASLTAVHVIEDFGLAGDPATRIASRKSAMRNAARLREEFQCVEGLRWAVLVEEGTAGSVILDIATRERADLIITGIAKSNPISLVSVSNTATLLAQSSPIPVLVVKKRVLDTNGRIVMATDLGFSSEPAFKVGLNWFANQDHSLFHAYDPPYRMWVDDKETYGKASERSAIDQCRQFVTKVGGEQALDRLDVLVRCGDVVEALSTVVCDADIDLVVAGTHGRTGILNMLVESVASGIVSHVESDALIVPFH